MLPTMILTIPMMKLSLQELYFIGRRLVCGYYLQRQRCSWTLPMGILTLGYRPHHWRPRRGKSWALLDGSRVEGAESAVHVVLSNSTANILLSIQICFSPISERSCNISKVLGIFIVKFNTLLYSGFGVQCDYAHLEHWLHRPRPHQRRWLEALGYNIVFLFQVILYVINLRMYYMPSFKIISPFIHKRKSWNTKRWCLDWEIRLARQETRSEHDIVQQPLEARTHFDYSAI
jgi:hypothetical protein